MVLQVSEPPMALQPLGDLWFGTGFLRFRFGAPILPGFALILGSSCRETCLCRQLIEVLGALAAQRALCRGRSETKSLSLVTLSFVPSPRQLTKRTDHFRYMIHGEKRVQNRRTSCSEYSHAAPRPSQSRTRGLERAARFAAGLKLDYGVLGPLTRGDAKAPTVPPCCERGGSCCVKMSTLQRRRSVAVRWSSSRSRVARSVHGVPGAFAEGRMGRLF